jgi:hypothetical protein
MCCAFVRGCYGKQDWKDKSVPEYIDFLRAFFAAPRAQMVIIVCILLYT